MGYVWKRKWMALNDLDWSKCIHEPRVINYCSAHVGATCTFWITIDLPAVWIWSLLFEEDSDWPGTRGFSKC